MWSKVFLLSFTLTNLVFSEEITTSVNQISNSENELNDRPIVTFKRRSSSETELESLKEQLNEIEEDLEKLTSSFKKSRYPKNCKEVQEQGNNATGVYVIQPDFADEAFLVVCDMQTRGGGWAYILIRFIGLQDFELVWDEYKNGFGNLAGEFWLGLENLHDLTGHEVNELLIELEDWDGGAAYAHYSYFGVGGENEGYRIKLLGGYNGTAGDSFSIHAGMKFTTKDKDQDRYKHGNCAYRSHGGWWYNKCANSLLTGKYLRGTSSEQDEFKVMFWETFHSAKYSLKVARMMVRPRDNQ